MVNFTRPRMEKSPVADPSGFNASAISTAPYARPAKIMTKNDGFNVLLDRSNDVTIIEMAAPS
jgi:hypothetical protein